MPYPITQSGDQFCVNGKCYDNKADAEAYQRALYANAPDVNKATLNVIKQSSGLYRWYSTTTNNLYDRDGEAISERALQADVARTKMFGDDTSSLYFYHISYPIGGAPDYRNVIDGMLVETGEYFDDPVSKAVAEFTMAHPEGLDGTGWGMSPGFMGVPDRAGIYHSILMHERSQLPRSKAANAYTSFGVQADMAFNQDQQKALDLVLADTALLEMVKQSLSAQAQSKMATEAGLVRKMADVTSATVTEAPTVSVPTFTKSGEYNAEPLTPQTQLGFPADEKPKQKKVKAAKTAPVEGSAEEEDSETADEAAAEGDKPKDAATAKAAQVAPALSDEDMKGIALFVNETVTKAVQAVVGQLDGEVKRITGDIQKMRHDLSAEAQVKAMNEIPATTYDRLKSYGAVTGTGLKSGDTGFIEKGQNLPAAPSPVSDLMSYLGFTPDNTNEAP